MSDGPKIFAVVIDDEPAVLETMKMFFESNGFKVVAATSAEEALASLENSEIPPDIVIADYRLAEGMVGTEAIHRIQDHFGTEIPGIIVTGDTSPDRIREAAASGFRILHKPVRANILRGAVDEVLQSDR